MGFIPALLAAKQSFESPNIEGLKDMFGAAQAAMKAVGLTKVKINPDNVSGLSTDAIVAITFLRCGKVFNGVIMVAGSDLSHTKTILDKLLKEMPKHIPNL